jgi:lysozyme family protein
MSDPAFKQKFLDDTIAREGSTFTNVPGDRGGPTKYGVTYEVFCEFYELELGKPVPSVADLEALDETSARTVLWWNAWERYGLEKIPNDDVAEVMFDCAVNHGGTGAIKLLQQALGVTVDGHLGPQTILAIPHLNGLKLALRITLERVRLQGWIVTHVPNQAKFAHGWANRSADIALGLLARLG